MEKHKLSDLADIIGGGTPKTSRPDYWGGDIPWLSVVDFNNDFRHVFTTEKTITEAGLNNSSTRILYPGEIIISARGTVGALAQVTREMAFNQSCYGLRAKPEITCNDYLYYLLRDSIETIKKNTHGSVFDTITRDTFDSILVDLPDLKTQKKIASALSSFDDKIELNAQINHNLEEQAKAIFDDMFPGITDGDSCVGDIITPKRGKSLLSKDAVPGDVPVIAGGLEPATFHNVSNTTPPVLTISASGANAGYVSLWTIPVWSSDSSFIDSSMTGNVYFWYVLLKKRQKEIFDAQTGSAQPHIYPQHIAQMSLANISKQDIEAFTHTVKPIFDTIGENKKQNKRLAQLRDSLLPKLMSGEIDVSEVEV